jgi:hypothetical protein
MKKNSWRSPILVTQLRHIQLPYGSGRKIIGADLSKLLHEKRINALAIYDPQTHRVLINDVVKASGAITRAFETVDEPSVKNAPPAFGEALVVLFAPKHRIDAVLGDLSERFVEEIAEKGLERAKLLFWARVARSIGPLLWLKVRKFGILAALFEFGRRLIP